MSIFEKTKLIAMQKSRFKKLDHFYSLCDKQSFVLDVGVSKNKYADSTNLFLKNFKLTDTQYTGLAVQKMDGIRKKYPEKKFVEYLGGVFPFDDEEFDWVFSNAVIEHVGNREDQLLFLNEMLRVGKNVFFTTPNRWFPIESHTNTFIRHWFNESFYKWCKLNRPKWNIDNLLLFGRKDLILIIEKSNAQRYKIKSNRIIGWPMTFTIVCSKDNDCRNKNTYH